MRQLRIWRQCFAALVLVVLAPLSVAAASSGFGNYQTPILYAEHTSSTLYLPMRDGVKIAVRVTRPARDGKPASGRFPVIWQATLAVNESENAWTTTNAVWLQNMPALTRYGYVIVQVARRGNGQSFGARRGYNDTTETDDAYEITEWLASQPWSDGHVGIYGCSNTGDAAMHALSARAPHLKAVFAGCFSWSKYDAMRRGGIFAQWGTGPQRTVEQDVAIEPVDGDADKVLLRQAAEEHQKSTNLLEMWKGLPYRDSFSPLVASRFWSEGSISSYAGQLRQAALPVYIQGGWHDELRDQGLIALLNIPGSRIVIGPWQHCQNPGFELLQEVHRFFDTYLKGLATGLAGEPRIHYYTMDGAGGGSWHSAESWPVAGTMSERWYVDAAHQLGDAAPQQAVHETFPVHTDVDCPGGGMGPFMQPCHIDGQGISFTGGALARALNVTGSPIVSIPLSADRSDANLFAYLEDVAPDGHITVVTEGRLKASLRAEATPPFKVPGTPWHRSYAEDAAPLVPGEVVSLHFDMMPASYVFAAGHRVQLTLMGADYRERARDPQDEGTQITIHSDAGLPASLELPVLQLKGSG